MEQMPQFLVAPEPESAKAINGLSEFLYTLYASMLLSGMPETLAQTITAQTANTFIAKSIEVNLPNATKK